MPIVHVTEIRDVSADAEKYWRLERTIKGNDGKEKIQVSMDGKTWVELDLSALFGGKP